MKRIFLFCTAALLLATLNVYAADSDYTVDADGVITKYIGFDTDVVIPATIGGKKITAIGKEAFRKADLTSVTIPDGIITIGESAFANNKLTAITIPGSVKTIEMEAFDGNNGITDVVLPDGIEEVATRAFPGTLKSINIPASIRSWELGLVNVPSVTLAENIDLDLYDAFFDGREYYEKPGPIFSNYIANDRKAGTYTKDMKCERKNADNYSYYETQYGAILDEYNNGNGGSTRVRVPAEIGGIAVKALRSRYANYGGTYRPGRGEKIVAVQIPEGITYIGPGSFINNQLQSVTIPASVTYIAASAFENNALTSVAIPSGVTCIGDSAFNNNGLTSVTISTGVQYIGSKAFFGIDSLYYGGTGNQITSVDIPASVRYIGDQAFQGNQIAKVTLATGLTYIGASAFQDNKITSVTIPSGVTFIGDSAFFGNQIPSITIPLTVTSIGGAPIGMFLNSRGEPAFNSRELVSVVMPANALAGQDSFCQSYKKNGRKAGRYTSPMGFSDEWTYSAR